MSDHESFENIGKEARTRGPPELVTRRTQIPKDDADWFDSEYPMYGAWTWFIGAALAAFRARHTVDVGPQVLVRESAGDVYEEGEDD